MNLNDLLGWLTVLQNPFETFLQNPCESQAKLEAEQKACKEEQSKVQELTKARRSDRGSHGRLVIMVAGSWVSLLFGCEPMIHGFQIVPATSGSFFVGSIVGGHLLGIDDLLGGYGRLH